jgi:hypothetical protein
MMAKVIRLHPFGKLRKAHRKVLQTLHVSLITSPPRVMHHGEENVLGRHGTHERRRSEGGRARASDCLTMPRR